MLRIESIRLYLYPAGDAERAVVIANEKDPDRIDRIHLNKKGHDVWTAKMKETLRKLGLQQQLC